MLFSSYQEFNDQLIECIYCDVVCFVLYMKWQNRRNLNFQDQSSVLTELKSNHFPFTWILFIWLYKWISMIENWIYLMVLLLMCLGLILNYDIFRKNAIWITLILIWIGKVDLLIKKKYENRNSILEEIRNESSFVRKYMKSVWWFVFYLFSNVNCPVYHKYWGELRIWNLIPKKSAGFFTVNRLFCKWKKQIISFAVGFCDSAHKTLWFSFVILGENCSRIHCITSNLNFVFTFLFFCKTREWKQKMKWNYFCVFAWMRYQIHNMYVFELFWNSLLKTDRITKISLTSSSSV